MHQISAGRRVSRCAGVLKLHDHLKRKAADTSFSVEEYYHIETFVYSVEYWIAELKENSASWYPGNAIISQAIEQIPEVVSVYPPPAYQQAEVCLGEKPT